MNRTIYIIVILTAIFAVPAKAAELEPVRMPEGIYVLNMAKSTVIYGTTAPIAQLVKVEKDKSTVLGFNSLPGNGITNFVINTGGPIDGKPRAITGSPTWDSTLVTMLDPFTVSEVRSKDGKPITKLITVVNPKGNTFTVSLIGPANGYLLVYEKQ
jgi:hypothetical protein